MYAYDGYVFTNLGNYRGKYYFNIQGFTRTVDNNYCGFDETKISGSYTINTHVAVNQGMSITSSINTIRNSTGQFAEYYSNKWHDNLSSYSKSYWWSVIPEITSNYGTYETLASYDNKICEIDGNYYRCKIVRNNSTQYQKVPFSNSPYSGQLTRHTYEALPTDDQMTSMQTSASYSETPKYFANHGPSTSDSSDYYLYYFLQDCYINLVQENIQVWTNLTNSTNRNHLIDAPYDMFVIPYSNDYQYTVNNQNYTANKAMAINLAIEICRSLGTSAAYDIQVVPYCPMRNNGIIDFNDFSLINYEPIRKGSTLTTSDPIVGYYFWSTTSSQEFSITETDPLLTLNQSTYSYKEITQLFEYILCSPAKDSTYEFNPAMNRGINSWQISFNYRPYSSYVKVQPTWDYLYGESSYNGLTDTRGLLFNGNYSITQLSNAWADYLNQNKNYQQIFDTEVSTQINKFNKQQKAQWDTVGARNYSFNPIKSVLGIIGENKQMQYDREIFDMDIKAQKDIFNYQLDNIKSQPDAISKLTSINVDFRIYPFIEIYMGHSDDIKNFRNAMKWNGMTIMVQGYIREYLKPNQEETYIEASILRFNDYVAESCDYHLVTEINKELDKGLYFYADNTSNIDVQNENIGG
ncbi:MAG: hypothetical protein K5765_01750 [Clostridia bacterium]|nr:hypothetical protein [Clostridia bacterium]